MSSTRKQITSAKKELKKELSASSMTSNIPAAASGLATWLLSSFDQNASTSAHYPENNSKCIPASSSAGAIGLESLQGYISMDKRASRLIRIPLVSSMISTG
eukprot:1158983-Pelagomonas_calceolata.AAC.5